VPASCTGELQPLDVSVNDPFKKLMKSELSHWYAGIVKDGLDAGKDLDTIAVDLKMSTVKPIHARWLIKSITELKKERDSIMRGFRHPQSS
jgi:hypothetical protein